jgi:hypothetical protein
MTTTLKTASALAIAAATLIAGQAFAGTATNIGIQQSCTTTIMCCIPGKGCFSPNTPTGYTCNGGHAQPVTKCIATPRK